MVDAGERSRTIMRSAEITGRRILPICALCLVLARLDAYFIEKSEPPQRRKD